MFYSSRTFVMSPPTSLLTYIQTWQKVLLDGVDGRPEVVST